MNWGMLAAALGCGAALLCAGDRKCSLIVQVAGDPRPLTLRVESGAYRSDTVPVPGSGSAEFSGLPCGHYRVRLAAGDRSVADEPVTLAEGEEWVRLAPSDGTVAVGQLRLAATSREFGKALDALRREDFAGAERHLKKVIRIDEAHPEAHNDLGVCYIRTGRVAEAAAEFEAAVRLNPSPATHLNQALAFLQAQRYAESEAAARRALQLDTGLARAHFVLGVSLYKQNRDLGAALAELRQSADGVPRARIEIAAVLLAEGRQREAAAQLRAYLASGETRFRADVEHTLEALRK